MQMNGSGAMRPSHRIILAPLALGAMLAGCGGGGDDPPQVESGVLVDSAVAGIKYRTATQQGVTDSNGFFDYAAGETVIFSIGGIDLPPTLAKGYLQPQDIFTSQNGLTNLARLLQSLDTDGDPSNGITLDPQVHTAFAGTTNATVAFDVPTATFGANATVTGMVSQYGGPGGTLVSAETALAHLADSTLVGAWHVQGSAANYAFTRDGHYMHVAADGGIEYGTYVWNPVTGLLTGSPVFDSNGTAGLSSGGVVATPSATQLQIGTTTLLPATSASSAIVGGWSRHDVGDGYTSYMVFTPEGRFTIAKDANPDELAGLSAQVRQNLAALMGTYVWNPQTGLLSLTLVATGRPSLDELDPDELVQTFIVIGDRLAPDGQGPGDDDGDIYRIR